MTRYIWRLMVWMGFALAACGSSGDAAPAEGSADDVRASLLAEDSEVAAELARPGGSSEARVWLSVSNNVFYNETSANIPRVVNGFYAAGAPQVLIYGIERLGGHPIAGAFAVQLPTDPAARQRVFSYAGSIAQQAEEDAPPDVGQRYLTYAFD